ncbi:MAG: hypothetical protein JO105_01640 [Hyphomicrobiales bacterium]|nr:hypothetical protein [Hyphomicrobiales bacterium]
MGRVKIIDEQTEPRHNDLPEALFNDDQTIPDELLREIEQLPSREGRKHMRRAALNRQGRRRISRLYPLPANMRAVKTIEEARRLVETARANAQAG